MPARILVIEDNEANLELMSYLLRAYGHTVIAARDGPTGLEIALSRRADLVLCDVQLPGIGGIEIAHRIRSRPAFDRIPLVAVTALAMVGDRESILAAGFDGYFSKPLVPDTFVQQVEAFLPPALRGGARQTAATPVAAVPRAREGPLILVVDDKQDNLDLAASLFGGSGYRVMTASDARAALALARQTRPDLILSDVAMAEGSGYEFIQAVKGDPELEAIPFVFITSTVTTEAGRQKGLALGATKYLFRPVEPRQLLEEIEACLRRRDRS